jgi:serine O-acetyltransferase
MASSQGWRTFVRSVRADHEMLTAYRRKYHGDRASAKPLLLDAIVRIGFQMLIAIRFMGLLDGAHCTVLARIVSRFIRHAYGAEIHWKARFDDGIAIVHGHGLVVGHAVVVGGGCILFQGVTLGEGTSPDGRVGSPQLGREVHVGPGAVLLGPISVGDRSKIMANVVLAESVASEVLVGAPAPVIEPRRIRRDRKLTRVTDG